MTLNGEMAVIVRYPTEFGSLVKLCLPLGLGSFWYWFLADVTYVHVRYMLSAVRLSSVCRQSVVCDVGAPYSGG